jgi:hypothetical protein
MQDVLLQDGMVAVYSVVMGYLFGALVYVISGAFWAGDQALSEPGLPRAVVRVPERDCRSVRCAFSRPEQSEHLVEVNILEQGGKLIKVEWPRPFDHLEEWIYRTAIVEELSDHTRLADDLERWLSNLGGSEDADSARPLPIPTTHAV